MDSLLQFLPDDFESRLYIEPFLGSGTLFFATEPAEAVIGDLNGALMSTYRCVRANAATVGRLLTRHMSRNSPTYYNSLRSRHVRDSAGARAARFIYLNATGFNGVYRVNKDGRYNVPYGKRHRPIAPTTGHLQACGEALEVARLLQADYHQTLAYADRHSFVYLDPPYLISSGGNSFAHYTKGRFNESDHESLAAEAHRLDGRGVLLMMSNLDAPLIRRLYKGFRFYKLPVTRVVSGNGARQRTHELLITNY